MNQLTKPTSVLSILNILSIIFWASIWHRDSVVNNLWSVSGLYLSLWILLSSLSIYIIVKVFFWVKDSTEINEGFKRIILSCSGLIPGYFLVFKNSNFSLDLIIFIGMFLLIYWLIIAVLFWIYLGFRESSNRSKSI